MAEIVISTETERLCGFRRPGANGWGIYLMGDGEGAPCGRMPFPLEVCPCCGGGVKPSRGTTWIEPANLFEGLIAHYECDSPACWSCPLTNLSTDPALLLWVGEAHYPTAKHFMVESNRMGISRKIPSIPHDFRIGRTWVYLAHRKAIPIEYEDKSLGWIPGIFMAFRPTHIDMVIDDVANVPEYPVKLQDEHGTDRVRIVKVVKDTEK